ncbi:MAG: ABC transporter permease [Terriglobia bacterium]
MASFRLFYRIYLRPLRREPLRAGLAAFAVALGVAVVLAIDLAGRSAAGSFHSSMQTLVGNADLEVTAPGGVPGAVLGRLATLPYPLKLDPRIEGSAVIAATGQNAIVIGLDFIAHAPQAAQNSAGSISSWDTNGILAGAKLDLKAGEPVNLIVNDHKRAVKVEAILPNDPAHPGEDRVLVMDIGLAARLLGRGNTLSRIMIHTPPGSATSQWEQRLRTVLPPNVTLQPAGTRTRENQRMLRAFRWNLRLLSYISLIVGAFLIYNTVSVSVVRRRPEIGVLRALGATRTAILISFLGESAFMGLLGSIIGIGLGRLLAIGAVHLVGSTVNSLYISSQPGPIVLGPAECLLGLFIGIGISVISALAPAREAARVPPIEAMARGRREYEAGVRKKRNLLISGALGLGALAACRLPPVGGRPVFGYVSALLLVGACALAIPAMIAALASFSSRWLLRWLGPESFLASRSLAASLRRTSVLVAALATAIGMLVSVGVMVGSFRQTVLIWMGQELRADFYVQAAGSSSPDEFGTLSPDLPQKIAVIPGVAAVGIFRAYPISYQGLPALLAGVNADVSARYNHMPFLAGGRASVVFNELVGNPRVIVSEPFANKHHVRVGDTMTLPIGTAPSGKSHPVFRVIGVYYDYARESGTVMMDRSTLLKYLPDPSPDSLAVYLSTGVHEDAVGAAINRACAGRQVSVSSNRKLRTNAIRIFDRTFAITYALEAVAVVVAVMGIAGALFTLVLDRRRELALLRFLGASKQQIRSLILYEAGLLGLLANVAGIVLGFALSLVLVFVINKQSFGWTIQFHWPVAVLAGALLLVYASTLAAGIRPARMAVRLNPIDVIHEE